MCRCVVLRIQEEKAEKAEKAEKEEPEACLRRYSSLLTLSYIHDFEKVDSLRTMCRWRKPKRKQGSVPQTAACFWQPKHVLWQCLQLFAFAHNTAFPVWFHCKSQSYSAGVSSHARWATVIVHVSTNLRSVKEETPDVKDRSDSMFTRFRRKLLEA